MNTQRQVEVFTAGCPACDETVQLVRSIACDSCDVTVHNMNEAEVAQRAKGLGIRSVPAVVVNGQLAECCANRGPTEDILRKAGIGQSA
jgi:glutaredoxin 3